MFVRSSHPFRHTRSPSASEASLDQGTPYGMSRRQMGPPPPNYPPQPVEIDPVSYPRISSSYSLWEPTPYPVTSIGEPNASLPGSLSINKTITAPLDFGVRHPSQDSLATWWNSNDSPWIPRGAVPEVSPEDRVQPRGYSLVHRGVLYGPQAGANSRPVNPSESGSIQFGVPPSDSGYGTVLSHESASVRGSDILDHSLDNRSLGGRVHEFTQHNETRPSSEPHELGGWNLSSPNVAQYRCDTCQKYVKTKSELKKHDLRHRRPFRCPNGSCNRTEGFSTINDLDRHIRCKHPSDLPDDRCSKIFRCPVTDCRSKGKNWPRLDNFKSHLKRMHGFEDGIAMDSHVYRATMDVQPRFRHPSQENSQESPQESKGKLDDEHPIGDDPADYEEISWDNEPEWNVSSIAVERQDEMMNPLPEVSNIPALVPENASCLVGTDEAQEQAECLQDSGDSGALWKPDATNGGHEEETELQPSGSASKSMTLPVGDAQGASTDALFSKNLVDRGKTPRRTTAASIDPCLRDALTTVFFRAGPGKDAGPDQAPKPPHGIGSPDLGCTTEAPPCRTACDMSYPAAAVSSTRLLEQSSPDPSPSGPNHKDFLDQDENIQFLFKTLKDIGYVLRKDKKFQTGFSSISDSSRPGTIKRGDHISCTVCRKFRGRQCELNKHMKRHNRPYGCTFCRKGFGSKNDWKRHENSQHYQRETWRCNEKNGDGASCDKVFDTADKARDHFTKIHKVTGEAVEIKINERRIGPNNLARFWCGFCETDINLDQDGLDAWDERFNHIDDHFFGRHGQLKRDISQWRGAEGDREGVQVSPRSTASTGESGSDSSSSPPIDRPSRPQDVSPPDITEEAVASPPSRKRSIQVAVEEIASKPAKRSKHEVWIYCCECTMGFNSKTTYICPQDNHTFCNQCNRTEEPFHGD